MCQKHPQLPFDDFVDGLLDDGSRAVVAAHLKECPACAAYVEALSETRDLLQQTEPISASQQFEQRLDTRLRWEDLKREGFNLLALGLAAVAALLRPLLGWRGDGRTSAASVPTDEDSRQGYLFKKPERE